MVEVCLYLAEPTSILAYYLAHGVVVSGHVTDCFCALFLRCWFRILGGLGRCIVCELGLSIFP